MNHNCVIKKNGILESFNEDEEYLYEKAYLFIKGYATHAKFQNTIKALTLARKVHNNQYRKGTVKIGDKDVKLPYVLHCLKVCSTLISLDLPFPKEQLDILYASALLHDSWEDASEYFPNGADDYIKVYGFPKEVPEIIMLLSKRSGATDEELLDYFNRIKKNVFATLIKLADRSHNVEDLYSMTIEKLHEYVAETRNYIYPLATYAKQNYPETSNGVTILKSKIVSLTELTETLVVMYEEKIEQMRLQYEERCLGDMQIEKNNSIP